MVHWVYVIKCDDDFIYVGETEHLYKRLQQHITQNGGKNTSAHIPRQLLGLYKVSENYSYYLMNSACAQGIPDISLIYKAKWGKNPYNDNLLIENHITERLFYERRNNHEYGTGNEWYRIRGGKYTRSSLDESLINAMYFCQRPNRVVGSFTMTTPIDRKDVGEIVDRPLCKCNIPSEVKLSKDGTKIYYVCALKNVWPDFFKYIHVEPACDFWELCSIF